MREESVQWLTDEFKKYKKLHYDLARKYNRFRIHSDETMVCRTNASGTYYYLQWREGGKTHRRYLGTEEDETVQEIQSERFLKNYLIAINDYLKALHTAELRKSDLSVMSVNNMLPVAYRMKEEKYRALLGRTKAEEWREKALKFKREYEALHGVPYLEELKNRANDGTMVRSKSELNIYNTLLSLGVVFVYELPTEVCGKVIRPDFTIYCEPLDRLVIWEHFGRLFEEKYRLRFANTMDLYLKAGRVPCVDLLMSFDTLDGRLDAKAIGEAVRYLVCGEGLAA